MGWPMDTETSEDTIPIPQRVVAVAWDAYVEGTEAEVSVPAFVQWVRENQSDLFRIVRESVLTTLAEELIREQQTPKTAA